MSSSSSSNTHKPPTIDTLLRLVPTPSGPAQILSLLSREPASALAAAADANGYTLAHASASYAQHDLLRALASEHNIDVNVTDADGETPLFYAEDVETARVLVEELGADAGVRNGVGVSAGENAEENAEEEEGPVRGRWLEVASYLSSVRGRGSESMVDGAVGYDGESALRVPPRLPEGMRIDVKTVQEGETGDVEDADPEFRRRIEELAGRGDFESREGQEELKRLVEDAVGGLKNEMDGAAAGGGLKSSRT